MKKILHIILFIMIFIVCLLFYSRYIGTTGLVTHEIVINDNNLNDSFDGLKIVQFSDLHYTRIITNKRVKELVEEINLINPDIVFFTGDLIDKYGNPNEKNQEKLANMLKEIKAKYGKYAVIGEDDYGNHLELVEKIYEKSNFKLLENEYDVIYNNNNDKLFIGGLNTYSYNQADIDTIMEYFNDNDDINYKIILVHEPDYIDTITSKYNVNLVLAGHSHNGQVNIPFIKNFFLPYGSKKYYDNYYMVDDTPMYVSSGIGESRVNLRLFNRPSINFYRINKI